MTRTVVPRRLGSERPVILGGTPSSGTSIVAHTLGRAGLFLGDALRPPEPSNPEGCFEDQDLVAFHDELLSLHHPRRTAEGSFVRSEALQPYQERATELVRRKFHRHEAWGFKDCRTALFPDFWSKVLPDARFIFTIRRPRDVLASMRRHGVRCGMAASEVWSLYTRSIVAFAVQNPDRALVVISPDDLVAADPDLLERVLVREWKLPLRSLDFRKAYLPGRMKGGSVRRGLRTAGGRAADRLFAEAVQLGESRRSQSASSAARARVGEAMPGRVICLVSPHESAYSETFVRDHIRLLPATVKVLYGGPRPDVNGIVPLGLRRAYDLFPYGYFFPNRHADGRRLVALPVRCADLLMGRAFPDRWRSFGRRVLGGFLRREGVDAVLAEFGQTAAKVVHACVDQGVPLIAHFHGYDAYNRRWVDELRPSYQEMFSLASAIVAVSRDMLEELAAMGAPREKLFYNPCGADLDLFRGADPLHAEPTLLAVGRFVEKKAPDQTLRAFALAFEECPEARLVMVGDGVLLERCRRLATELDVAEAVTFAGVLSQFEVAAMMREARAFVQHSIRTVDGDCEGTPVSVLEAAASGLPIVSTRHGGIKDVVVEGSTGLLVDEGDVHGMSRAMIELIRSPERAAALGRGSRERIRSAFSRERSLAGLAAIIETAIERDRP